MPLSHHEINWVICLIFLAQECSKLEKCGQNRNFCGRMALVSLTIQLNESWPTEEFYNALKMY